MKKSKLQNSEDRRRLRDKLSTLLVGALVIAMLAILALLVWQKAAQRVDTSDFEGTIVDRWADYPETRYVSEPRFRLLVELPDGKQMTLKVDPPLYESAKVGMVIKRRSGQIVLIDSELKQTSGK